MRLKSMRGLLAHNFDTNYVHKLIEDNSLERDDTITILNNAVTVILSLRAQIRSISGQVDNLKISSDSVVNHEYMKGQK